ncbi:hypothetical protein GQ457_16G007130 [Hibiscus cannabinus]
MNVADMAILLRKRTWPMVVEHHRHRLAFMDGSHQHQPALGVRPPSAPAGKLKQEAPCVEQPRQMPGPECVHQVQHEGP